MQIHTNHTRRQLTYDELKAAEAAFQGCAFNEDWSEAARAVYEGIAIAKIKLNPGQGMGVWPWSTVLQKSLKRVRID
jgi:hypothetical protein